MEETGAVGAPAAQDENDADLPASGAAPSEEDEPAELSEEDLNKMVEELCESKAEEFRLLGYENVSGQDIWECVSDKYHKTGFPPLYAVVNDILSLKVNQFMNHITLNMYRGDLR